jgi:hypothetical protein
MAGPPLQEHLPHLGAGCVPPHGVEARLGGAARHPTCCRCWAATPALIQLRSAAFCLPEPCKLLYSFAARLGHARGTQKGPRPRAAGRPGPANGQRGVGAAAFILKPDRPCLYPRCVSVASQSIQAMGRSNGAITFAGASRRRGSLAGAQHARCHPSSLPFTLSTCAGWQATEGQNRSLSVLRAARYARPSSTCSSMARSRSAVS